MPDVDCKIVDIETGTREVDAGEAGELCLRGPNLIDGYWQKPEETAAVLRDGWLYTGEIVFRTELPKTLIGKVLRRQLAACVSPDQLPLAKRPAVARFLSDPLTQRERQIMRLVATASRTVRSPSAW